TEILGKIVRERSVREGNIRSGRRLELGRQTGARNARKKGGESCLPWLIRPERDLWARPQDRAVRNAHEDLEILLRCRGGHRPQGRTVLIVLLESGHEDGSARVGGTDKTRDGRPHCSATRFLVGSRGHSKEWRWRSCCIQTQTPELIRYAELGCDDIRKRQS